MWWTHRKVETATPRKHKPLIPHSTKHAPEPMYKHNYGAGYSINYVPADWRSYQFKHILQLIELPNNKRALTCTCGHTAVRPRRETALLFHDMWDRHVATEYELKAVFEVLDAEVRAHR